MTLMDLSCPSPFQEDPRLKGCSLCLRIESWAQKVECLLFEVLLLMLLLAKREDMILLVVSYVLESSLQLESCSASSTFENGPTKPFELKHASQIRR